MALKGSYFFPLFIIIFSTVFTTKAQELIAEYSSTKMLEGGNSNNVFYDGLDSIYILGGLRDSRLISKYSIAEDNITPAGSLSRDFQDGSLNADGNGNLFLFGTYNDPSYVAKYDLKSNTTSTAVNLPWNVYGYPTLSSCGFNKVLILGGNINKILSFDMTTYEVNELVVQFPINLQYATAICVGNKAFVFIPNKSSSYDNVWELNLDSLELSSSGDVGMPTLSNQPTAITDGKDVYLITGFRANQDFPSRQGILRFDSLTNSTSFLPVANWPDQNEIYFDYPPKCVHVPNLNRSYCLGGWSGSGSYVYHDDIFYIDMDGHFTLMPTEPATGTTQISSTITEQVTESTETLPPISTTTMNPGFFTCNNRTNGFYPHPVDCSRFIGCHNGTMDHFACSSPLLFNPLTRICDLPHKVVCDTSCINKENGYYPHPQNCSLYIICDQEEATLVKCPPPLLFYPIEIVCNYPEYVTCNI